MNGEPGGNSLKMPVALVDILAAHHLKEGLLLAMISRTRTGMGDFVEVSLMQAAVASLTNQASNWLISGKIPQKQGSSHPNIAPYGDIFRTSDGREVVLAIGTDKQFRDLCSMLDIPEASGIPVFSTNQARVSNRDMLFKLLQERFIQFDADSILPRLNETKIPAGVVRNIKQVFDTPRQKSYYSLLWIGPVSGTMLGSLPQR